MSNIPLALLEGSTENATLVTELLVGLRARGLDVSRPMLVGIDGAKALLRLISRLIVEGQRPRRRAICAWLTPTLRRPLESAVVFSAITTGTPDCNEDDVRATLAVREWLATGHNDSRNPAPQVPLRLS